MGVNKQGTKEELIKFGEEVAKRNLEKEKVYTPNVEANHLIWQNPLAYLFAVIMDQGMRAERVWEIPYLLRQRLGHLDVQNIADIEDQNITDIFNQKPKLHRFPKTMALRLKRACRLVLEKYGGKVENLWNDNPRSDDLQRRFEEFSGIGQKKASMATNILVRDFDIKVKDKRGIDISYDVHVRRVFLRTDLVNVDDPTLMINEARKLNPEYPGILDNPCWVIGREFCHSKNPDCRRCPITTVCVKLTERDAKTVT